MKRALLVLAVVLLWLSGCAAPASSPTASGLGNGWRPDHSMALSYATQFSVDFYAPDGQSCAPATNRDQLAACEPHQYTLITIARGNTRFLVVPEGKSPPSGISPDIVVLTRPLQNLYVAASATMSLFVALDALESVRFSALAADNWYLPEAKAAMKSGQILFGGKYSAPDYELILSEAPGLAIENGMIYHSPEVKEKLESLGIPVLVEQSSNEQHPLGRTEWVKLIGVLLGKQAVAYRFFDTQAAHLKALSGKTQTGKTVAFFYISSAGYVVARKSGDYIPKMINLAGGEYVFANLGDPGGTSTVKLEMEKFYAVAKNADYIIYNSTVGSEVRSMADMLALSPLLRGFRAVQKGNVWSTDKDFYQDMTGLAQTITDMHRMLTDPTAPDQLSNLRRLR